jgi:C_GCAxxG_C_C family probable redox protein
MYLNDGFNCAQVVAVEYYEAVGKSKRDILAAASGFGGGIGRQGLTCGALTGAVIIIGLAIGQNEPLESNSKELTYKYINEFFTKFKDEYGAFTCKDLLGSDISTSEGLELLRNGYYRERCSGFIEISISILDDILKTINKPLKNSS